MQDARRADGLVGKVTVETDWTVIAGRLRTEITGGWDDSAGIARFEGRGGRFVRGWGKLTGPRTVEVDGERIEARRGVLVATGSSPVIPPIAGLSDVPFWTNHEVVAAEQLPESIVVLGGGAVGCELAQVLARFGSNVTIVEGADRLLPGEEPDVSDVLARAMAEDGIGLLAGRRAVSVGGDDASVRLSLDDGSAVEAERLLVAVGRRSDAGEVGVAAAGATMSRGFVEVDGRMRAADGLWAIGDITGEGLLTSVAVYQGRIAVEDILGADPRPADYSAIPRTTFTDPEIGSVGMTEAQAREAGIDVQVVVKNLQATFRGYLHRTGNAGIIKLVADRTRGRLIGASVAGPEAGETLGFLQLAVGRGIPLEALVDTIYPFPTFYGGVGEALGAYGRGIARVLDPDTPPMFDDPQIST